MPCQWIIQPAPEGFNVLWRSGEADSFERCNEKQYKAQECLSYILAYARPNDCIIADGFPWVFMEKARA